MSWQGVKVLIADDDATARLALQLTLTEWGYDVTLAPDGDAAWEILKRTDSPSIAILDWMMPGLDGVELCRRVRIMEDNVPRYLLLLSAQSGADSVSLGLDAGADDYVSKPFAYRELQARVAGGARVVRLELERQARMREMEKVLEKVELLSGLLPICSYCKSVRNDGNYWQRIEQYFAEHSHLTFSHGICPGCLETHFGDIAEAVAAHA